MIEHLTPQERIAKMAAQPNDRADAPIIECPACLDSGWEERECHGSDCGRRRRHRTHTYATVCGCRPMNRTYQERIARSRRRDAA